jgi:hypothetical protein
MWAQARDALVSAGLSPEACWIHEVREWFDDPHELYKCLAFWWLDEAPAWDACRSAFEAIFRSHSERGEIPHGRTIWRARAP